VPLIEIYLLIEIGSIIGALPTVFLVVATAVIGAFLLRLQGFTTWNRLQMTLMRGEIPALELAEGAVLLVCGALLLTPGFFTDTLGFLGLFPPTRRAFIRWAMKHANFRTPPPGGPYSGPRKDGYIEGEYRRDD
jgi:UPF0716 protein FxsA